MRKHSKLMEQRFFYGIRIRQHGSNGNSVGTSASTGKKNNKKILVPVPVPVNKQNMVLVPVKKNYLVLVLVFCTGTGIAKKVTGTWG